MRIIKYNSSKPNSNGENSSNTAFVASGSVANVAKEAAHAVEADHSKNSDLAARAKNLTSDSTDWQTIASNLQTAIDALKDLYLSKTTDDTASGVITFLKGLVSDALAYLKDGAKFGDFVSSIYAGKGGAVDENGNAEFESVKVRSSLETLELIVNRLSAIEGDVLFTESDTIDSVDDLGDSTYGLHLKSKWDGYFTAQAENNVLKGIINTLASGSGTYHTSWMRVNSVNTANNYIEVTLYGDAYTPAGKNYPPQSLMKIARWGNQTDTTRQGCFYLSSSEGRIVHLVGVTKPILEDSNYASSQGSTLEFLKSLNLPTIDGLDYLYARGLIVQDIIRVDVKGSPIATYVNYASWDSTKTYYCKEKNPDTGVYEISCVWQDGCKYACAKTGSGSKPAWNNTDWAMIEGNPDFSVSFEEAENIFDPDNFKTTLTLIAKLYNQDVTADILDSDIAWTRYSEDEDGNERTESDNAWALKRAGSGKQISLTADDCDFNGYIPPVLKFICTVTLRDGTGTSVASGEAVFGY